MLNHSGHTLSVRDITLADLPLVDAYWDNMSAADLRRMGVDPEKLKEGANVRHRAIEESIKLPYAARSALSLIWLVDGKPIGNSVLREIIFGQSGEIHLHNFFPEQRGKGFGTRLLLLSMLRFTELFQLKQIICEPEANNPHPNGTLKKLGFTPVRTYTSTPSVICYACTVNRYEIDTRELNRILQQYL